MQQCCSSRQVARSSPCPHVRSFKVWKLHSGAGGLEAFHLVQQYLQGCRYRLWDPAKLTYPTCSACKDVVGRLRVCMGCINIACVHGGHAQQHAAEKNHPLAVEAWASEVFCVICNDFVYDADLDFAIFVENNTALAHMQRMTRLPGPMQYLEWRPSKVDATTIAKFSRRPTIPAYQLGLRGLHNLGNTCFMNCILQAFLHNPLLRNYFLADMHDRAGCTLKTRNPEGICMGCEMDLLFTQVFSGQRAPYNPHHLLYVTWKYANSLAGYEQQDAHEFLITALNGLHAHCGGQAQDCRCVVHRIFSGLLHSAVTCVKCGAASVTQDPMFDISLDLPKREEREDATTQLSLASCLQRFTSAERLGVTEKYMCSKCNTMQEVVKQLSLQTLPSVICLHLKRFEHSQNGGSSSKISTFVEFPEEIDMTPYLTSASRSPSKWDHYELFTVVNHHGEQVNKGHYTAFVKHTHVGWLRCDDASLTRASLQQVLQSEAYLLFYIKKCLDYEKRPA